MKYPNNTVVLGYYLIFDHLKAYRISYKEERSRTRKTGAPRAGKKPLAHPVCTCRPKCYKILKGTESPAYLC